MTNGSLAGPDRPRIAPLPPDDPIARRTTVGSDHNGGRPLNIFLTLARNEGLYKAFGRLGGYLLFAGTLPAREREIVILRVGALAQSEYEFGQHTVIGLDAGLTAEEIERLATPGVTGWSAADEALVRLVDELCADDVVSEATWQQLAERWNDAELLELLVLAGFYRLVSGMLSSAGVALEPTTPGWPSPAADRRRSPRAEPS
jgi:4-carboxymuconolactone decarboxylase